MKSELSNRSEKSLSYSVHARDEEFLRLGAEHFRRNEIWRERRRDP